MPRSGTRFLAILLVSLAGCPKRVVVNGQEMPASSAAELARAELEAVRAQSAGLPPAEAAERLEAVAARYREVDPAADALFEAAERWREAGNPDRAAAALRRLVIDHPLFPRANEAKYRIALADVAAGRPADGLSTLSSLWPRLPDERRPEAARAAADAAVAARAWPEAVRWLSAAAALGRGPEREALRTRMAEVVDGWLSFLEVARLREALPSDAPAQEVLTMKLARIQLHLRDYPRAAELAREVFLRWPDGPWADDAKAILDRIERLTFVRPDVIGLAIPLSGTFRRWGEAILQGIGVALPEGSGLRLAVRDSRGEPDGAVAAVESLALEEGAIVVIGGVTNAEADRAAATAEELQLPFISLSKQEGVTAAGPHVFQNMLTASAQARALVDYAMARHGMRRFALLFPDVPYGVELANAFWDEVEVRGGEIRAAETYAMDSTTFTPLVKSMVGKLHLDERPEYQAQVEEIARKEKDPFRRRKALERAREKLAPVVDFEAVFIPDFTRNVKLIAPALAVEDVVTATCDPDEVARIARTTGRPDLRAVQLLGSNGWGGDPTLYDASPGAPGRHLKCAVFVDGFFPASRRPETRRFVESFARKHQGAVPGILEASAHDAARMARQVIEQQRVAGRAQVREGLAGLRGFRGATGDITMRPDRTPEKELFFLRIGPEGLVELEPAEVGPPGAGGDAP
jgi:ABC-type branched-subunit amino acid transport system substrate-binding protein/predicted negative regulator of RcsB-dependent stress response